MDRLGLDILVAELQEDIRVFGEAIEKARLRLEATHPGAEEACGFELNRAYNILEKCFERICVSFENHFEKRGHYHEQLIDRMGLALPGIRPAFLPREALEPVRELKGFRHIFRHAYELTLKRQRLLELIESGEKLMADLPGWIGAFQAKTRSLLGKEESSS